MKLKTSFTREIIIVKVQWH